MNTSETLRGRGRQAVIIGFVFLSGYLAAHLHDNNPSLVAQQKSTPERTAFLSGGERSVLVLESMQKTLEKMDQRLASIEKSTTTLANRSTEK